MTKLTEIFEEIGIMTIVEREKIFFHVGITVKDLENFRALDNFVSQFVTRETYHTHVNGVSDECVIIHELVTGESTNRIQEEIRSLLKIPNSNAISSLIYFQSISSVPIAAFFNQTEKKK